MVVCEEQTLCEFERWERGSTVDFGNDIKLDLPQGDMGQFGRDWIIKQRAPAGFESARQKAWPVKP